MTHRKLDLTHPLAASVVSAWYASARDNDDHPFTIPPGALWDLALRVQEAMDAQQCSIDVLRAVNRDLVTRGQHE